MKTPAKPRTVYPLFFRFRDLIAGADYWASVAMVGRALLVNEGEDEGWALYGINPGSLVGCGDTREEAQRDFRRAVREVLYDIANDASDFRAFAAAIEEFVGQLNEAFAHEWETAVQAVRQGDVNLKDLVRVSADETRPEVVVSLIDRASPAVNDEHGVDTELGVVSAAA